MSARTLTARGVRTMLARRGVDHSSLTITETVNGNEVRVEGPYETRRAATYALVLNYEDTATGMSVAPFPEHDILIRR